MRKISETEYFSNDGNIRFLNMDCNVFMKGCRDKEFSICINDPPYGIDEDGSKNKTRGKLAKPIDYKAYSSGDKEPPKVEIFNQMIRCSKNQIIWGANHFISRIPLDSSCWIVWDKDNGGSDFADCELAYTSFKTAVRIFKFKWQGMLQGNMKNKQKRIHGNEKPIALYKWLLEKYTKPTDTILDCFGGSMSHAIAAHQLGRKLTIIELDKDYFDAALARFQTYETKAEETKLLGYAKTELEKINPILF